VVQTASIVVAFPMAFLFFAVIYGVFRGLTQSIRETALEEAPEALGQSRVEASHAGEVHVAGPATVAQVPTDA
jgi:choline-glycine betaine transporter